MGKNTSAADPPNKNKLLPLVHSCGAFQSVQVWKLFLCAMVSVFDILVSRHNISRISLLLSWYTVFDLWQQLQR